MEDFGSLILAFQEEKVVRKSKNRDFGIEKGR